MKHYSPDAKTDYSTDFCQPPSSSVVGKLQVRYCSQLHPGNSNQFQAQAGQKSAYAGLILTSPQFVYVCSWRAQGWHTAATLAAIVPTQQGARARNEESFSQWKLQ